MNKEMTVNGKTGTNEQFFRSVMTYFGYNKRIKFSID